MMALLLMAQRLLLTLHLSLTVGSAPCVSIARVEVDDHIRGGVCLVWESDNESGQSCWSAEQGSHTVWRPLRFTHEGTYTVWVSSAKVRSNVLTVEVR